MVPWCHKSSTFATANRFRLNPRHANTALLIMDRGKARRPGVANALRSQCPASSDWCRRAALAGHRIETTGTPFLHRGVNPIGLLTGGYFRAEVNVRKRPNSRALWAESVSTIEFGPGELSLSPSDTTHGSWAIGAAKLMAKLGRRIFGLENSDFALRLK
jgi:hypothetical protein